MTSFAYTPGTRCTRAASARDAVERLRASGRSTRSARRHEGNTKREGRACRVRWGDGRRQGVRPRQVRNGRDALVASDGGTDADVVRPRQVRNGRDALVASDGGTDADGVRPRQARPSRVLDLYDNPIISRPLSIRSFPVPLQWMKQRASQPQNQSPCPRASACSVLTGRRPRDVPAPPRRVALGGGPEPPAGHTERAETRRKYETGGTRLSRPMGGRTPTGVRPRQARPSRRFVHGVSWVDLAVLLLPLLSFPCGVLLRVVGAGQLFEDFPRGQQSLPRRTWNCSASRW